MVNLKDAAAGLWRAMRHDPDRPLLHEVYERVQVEQSLRGDLELLLGPSRTKYYVARRQGGEIVEFITDPDTRKVRAKKYLTLATDTRGAHDTRMRFSATVRLVRQLLATRAAATQAARPRHASSPRSLLEWFTGSSVPKLLGRPGPGDRYFVNGRPIQPRAYRTLLHGHDGDDLVIELHTAAPRC